MVYRISIALVIALVGLAGLAPQAFGAAMQALLAPVVRSTGWLYLLVVFMVLAFLLYLV